MDSTDDARSWPEPPDLLELEGEVDDPVLGASMMLRLMRTMRILERSEDTDDAMQRLRDSSDEWSASQEAQIGLDAFRIVDNLVGRVLPNPLWTGVADSAHFRPGWPENFLRSRGEVILEEVDDPAELAEQLRALMRNDNKNVERALRLLRDFFENLCEVAKAVEQIGGPIQPDPSARGGARVRRGNKRTGPSVLEACVRALLVEYPPIARLSAGRRTRRRAQPSIRNTQLVRDALHDILKGYPYYFDPQDIDPGVRGALSKVLGNIQRPSRRK